jgi:ubiquinone biosynthesis UbiH/UbiF/VisC/COQ6 family hydroxylase
MGATVDVAVAGGGPVGWACALAARVALGPKSKVTLVERDALPSIAPSDPLYPRVYTVAAGHLAWLAAHDVAFDDARSAPVRQILVAGRDGGESLRVGAADAARDELARVMEHEALTLAIATRAQQLGVQMLAGETAALHAADDMKLLELADRRMLSARVVIVADGARSRLRAEAGVEAWQQSYAHHGVVAHLACAAPHRGAARQWFLPDGSILALLPLPMVDAEPAVSMVWSAHPDRADVLCAMGSDELAAEVNAASAHAARVKRVLGSSHRFPLALVRAANPVAERVVVVGDAAHAVHPLAGQGVNLGLADARALGDLWLRVSSVNGDPGHSLLLGRYRRVRYGPTLAMQLATDGLFRLYNQADHPFLMAAGDAGMRLFGRLPAFRRTLSTAAVQ